MADIQASSGVAPVTDDVFLEDRKEFWSFFTGLVLKATIGIAVLIILLAYFLV